MTIKNTTYTIQNDNCRCEFDDRKDKTEWLMQEEIKEILKNIYFRLYCDSPMSEKYGIELGENECKILLDYITNLQEKLKVSQTNEETYRLEMQDITKILGLDEHTTFDEVKEYATNLQEENEYSNHCNEELRKKITNLEYKIERLEENNKNLKELCNKYEEEHNTTFIEWQKDIKANKKAIEYIEKYVSVYDMEGDLRERLLNILKGDNK